MKETFPAAGANTPRFVTTRQNISDTAAQKPSKYKARKLDSSSDVALNSEEKRMETSSRRRKSTES
jgi:hypothetical protein